VKKGGFDWFLNESPDVYCIQEVKAEAEDLEDGVRNPPGYFSYFDHSKGRKGYSGTAVYSRFEPEKVEFGIGIKDLDQEGRFVGLFFAAGKFLKDMPKTAILNIYFPNGGGGPERLAFKLKYYDHFLRYADKLVKGGWEVIFCGDINTAHEEIDLARPRENEGNTGFLPIERKWLDKVVIHGYTDVFRHFYPDVKGAYTYWDMKTFARERNVGWRIDYFFVTPKVLPKIDKMKTHDQIIGSDHCPIEIVIK